MNSLNLRQIDGGNVIKQADFGSNLSFELLDERRRKIPELDGQIATIRLIKGDNIAYQTESQVVDGSVSFKFDRVLEKGIYVLEIVAGNYVFPSNNMAKITIEKTAGNYKPENMVKTDLVELQGKITAIEQREHDVNQELLDVGQKQAEMTKRIETLESREDHDTIYNDTEIKNRLVALEQKEDKDTVYDDSRLVERIENLESDDTTIKERISALEEKPDKDATYDDTSLKAKIVELEEKLKSLNNTVKRPPYGYRLNRKANPWELIFDNGCILTFPLDTRHDYYGWNESPIGISTRPNKVYAYSTPEMIMWYVKGHRKVEYLKTTDASSYTEFINCELKNPINDSSLYNFDNAFGDASDDTLIGKRNFVKLLYELDAFIEADLLSVGVTKNEDR